MSTFVGSQRKQENSKKIYLCFIDYAKVLTVWITTNLWKVLKEMGIPDQLIYFLRNLYVSQEAVVKTEHEIMTGSKLGKEYDKAVYHCPVYLTPMQSTLRG